ncbi:MAG: hypothetical protein JRM77_06555 [Nitrososphaerota archaeon]|nr:hypothetical protein [Nitrososphaerota archaeon]
MVNQVDAKSLIPLMPYLTVLTEVYPNPIRASVLAQKTSRSKAAVTKVKGRLLQVCDVREMALGAGFRLVPTFDAFLNLFLVFSASGEERRFLGSRYASLFLKGDQVHEALATHIPRYSDYFTDEETSFMMDKVLEIVSGVSPSSLRQFAKSIIKGSADDAGYILSRFVPNILRDLKLTIKDEHELRLAISVRDKLFLAARDLVWSYVGNLSILRTVNARDREDYLRVYKHTTDYYLTHLFEALNTPIFEAARASSIQPKPRMAIIGSSLLPEIQNERPVHR